MERGTTGRSPRSGNPASVFIYMMMLMRRQQMQKQPQSPQPSLQNCFLIAYQVTIVSKICMLFFLFNLKCIQNLFV